MRYVITILIIVGIALLSWWLWRSSLEETPVSNKPKIVVEEGEVVGMINGRKSFELKVDSFQNKTQDSAILRGRIEGKVFDEKGEIIVSFSGIDGEMNFANSDFKIYSNGKIKGENIEVIANSISWINNNALFEANGDIKVKFSSYNARCSNIRANFLTQKVELWGNLVVNF
jgi:uncharacterized membrane protein YcaP (DUF421 family)